MRGRYLTLSGLSSLLLLAACQDADRRVESGTAESATGASGPSGDEAATEPAPAPVSFAYAVIGNPIVGQPVSINLEVSSTVTDRPVTLHYRINDPRDLEFPESQAQRVLLPAGGSGPVTQQVTVIPKREGRVFLNVSAEVGSADGILLKSMAIPVEVSGAPEQQPTQDNDGAGAETED